MKILVTGSTGFVGKALLPILIRCGLHVNAIVRNPPQSILHGVHYHYVHDLNSSINFSSPLRGVDVLIHLAARVHVIAEMYEDSLSEYRRINVDSTLTLANQAASLGVRRFVFVSSVKVNGDLTKKDIPFQADDIPNPQDSYGVSKMDAEFELMKLAKKTGMEVVIIRPPIIYGPDVKANFLSMIKILDSGIPLPFANIHNKRSLLFVDNLVDLLVRVIDHPKAAGQVFLVSDDHDVSTTTLLNVISSALGKKARLVPVPLFFLKIIFCLIGKVDLSQKLLGSLCLDISKTKELLDWTPPVRFEEGIKRTAKSFLSKKYHE
jgi:nucleoside-diphosphate-sugar epimerase